MKNNLFGAHLRKTREALNAEHPGEYTIRRVAGRVGIQSGYLSRVERGLAESLSEEKIKALAEVLGQDPDYLLALAGKVSSDVRRVIRDRPQLFAKLIRDMKDLPDTAVEAETQYRKIERRLNQAQSVARLGSWERNFQTGETYWSDSLYDLFEFDKNNGPPAHEDFISRVHPDDRDKLLTTATPGEPGAQNLDFSFRIACPGDRVKHAYSRVQLERDDHGEPLRIIGCTQDVTDRVETRRALARSEALLRSVLESPELVIIFSLDRDYRYLMFNRSHAKTMHAIWGVDIRVGMNMLDVIGDPEDRAKAKINFDRALAGEHFTMVEEYGDPGLSRKFWEDNYSPIIDENGEVIGLTVILTDVTERVKTSRALAESERLYRTLAENIPGCDVFLFDRSLRFLAAGGSELKRIGLNHENLLGRTLYEALDSETAAKLEPHYLKPLRGEESRMEFDFAESGYLAHAVPVRDKQGRPYLGLGLVMNITKLKQAEHALQEAHRTLKQKVEERTAELEKAKRSLEHELLERWTAEQALARSENLHRTLVETMRYGVVEADLSGKRTFTNEAMNRIYGYEPGELDGTYLFDMVDPDESERLTGYMDRLVREQPAPEQYVTRAKTKDGRPIDVLVDWNYERNEKGEVVGFVSVVTDVTEQKRAERELLEQRELFNTFADQIPGVAFIKDHDSRLLFINSYMDEVYGASRWLGMRADEFMPEDLARGLIEADRKTLAEGPQMFETTLPDKTGALRTWLEYKFPVNREGKPPLIGCVSMDVTARKKAEYEMREAKELFNTFADQIPGLAFIKDCDSRLVFANQGMRELYRADEHIGKRDDEYLPGDVARRTMSNDAEAMKSGPVLVEGGVPDMHGIERFWRTVKFPIRREEKAPLLGCVAIEITEERRLTEALRKSEERYRRMAENVTDVIWAMDRDLNLVYCSPSVRNLLGYMPDEVTALPRDELYTPEGLEIFSRHGEEILRLIESGDLDAIERTLEMPDLHKDGRVVWTEVGLKAVTDENGDFLHILGVTRDISERKKAEKRIRESLAEKEVLLQEIHHRVKNNLQVVSSLLDMTARRGENPAMSTTLKEMQAKVQAMSLIHAMIYRGESLNRVNFAQYLRSLYGEIAAMYSEQSKSIEPVFDLEDAELPLSQAVPCALVLNEIISNVFRHAFPGDMQGRMEVALAREDGEVTIRVADNGVGFPESMDPEETKTMGMKLIREIARLQLQGSVDFVDERGATVTLRFRIQ